MTEISTLAVVGAGYMGGGIAQTLALTGREVALADVSEEAARAAYDRLVAQARAFEEAELFPAGAAERIASHLRPAASIEEAVEGSDYVSEAVPEDPAIKDATLRRISAALGPDAVVGSNTSAIPIARLAESVAAPERFLGVHWWNPAPFVPCIEIIATEATDPGAVERVEALMREAGKETARVADTPGFVGNRLQFALYAEAARIVAEGVATPDAVDTVVRNSFGFRLGLFGPFAIGDMAGLDVYRGAYATLHEAYGDRFAVPEVIERAVASGDIGVKSGRGVLDIDPADVPELLAYRDRAYARMSALRAKLGQAPGL